MMAAHHHGIGLTGQADIVGIAPFAAQQHRVFGAWHRLADGEPVVEPEGGRIMWSSMAVLTSLRWAVTADYGEALGDMLGRRYTTAKQRDRNCR
jgi:hypothetical protein